MEKYKLILILISLMCLSEASLINDFIAGARNLWPKDKEISSMNSLKELAQLQFEIPKESEEFLKQGLDIINAPKEALDICSHRVIIALKKNCNQMGLEEIGKLAVMLMNCQLEIEGRSIYPCKPEMTLAQCTMGFDSSINHLYHIFSQRALSVCSAIKQQHLHMFTEIAINKLMQVTQQQTSSIHGALQNQKRINEMGIQNIQEYRDNFEKIKESQQENIEMLNTAKKQITELNTDLHRQFEIHQMSEQKLMRIEQAADEIAKQLVSTNEKIVQHYNQAIQFMEHFKSIMEVIGAVTTTIEKVLEKIDEITKEIGIEINQDTAVVLVFNLVYFMCGMVFILFVNPQRKYKRLLIGLYVFNNIAAFYQSDISLLGTNIFIWTVVLTYFFAGKFKEKLFSINFNIFAIKKSESDHRSISRCMTPSANPPKSTKKSKRKVTKEPESEDEDPEITNLVEQELININQSTPIVAVVAPRPETPSSRPLTPAIMRVMKTDGVDINRAGTPFVPGNTTRIQCQATTNLGAQCRNAAILGQIKCRVHNY